MENHIIVNHNDSLLLQKNSIITNVVELQNGKELLSFFDDHEWYEVVNKIYLNISVTIAAVVIASARIHMQINNQ